MEHTHTILTLLGLLALLLLAVSVAGAGGWHEGEDVRYTIYRTPPPTYEAVAPGSTVVATPWVWVVPGGWVSHLGIGLGSASSTAAGWIATPLLLGLQRPSCTPRGKEGNHESW